MEANNQSLTVDVKTCARILGLSERSTYRLVEQSYRGKARPARSASARYGKSTKSCVLLSHMQ